MKFKNVSKLITTFAIILCLLTFVACGTNGETATATDADTVSTEEAAETVETADEATEDETEVVPEEAKEEAVSEDKETAAETPAEEPAEKAENTTVDEKTPQETTEEPAAEVSNEEAEADSEFKFEVSPLPGDSATYYITSGYGPHNGGQFHPGVDIASETGTPIYAVADGTVATSDWVGGSGNCVIIDHANGWSTLYAHCDTLIVSEGASVKAGDQIATVGNTGVSTGPHLHLEVRDASGEPVDPAPYL